MFEYKSQHVLFLSFCLGRKKERKSDGFLNPEEFEYWKENFMEDEKSISCIPQSSLISLPKDRETEVFYHLDNILHKENVLYWKFVRDFSCSAINLKDHPDNLFSLERP